MLKTKFKHSVYMMKAKAEAEAKEMQAQGMKRGEDFLDCRFITRFLTPFPLSTLLAYSFSAPCLSCRNERRSAAKHSTAQHTRASGGGS